MLRGGAAPPIVAAVFRKAIVDVEVGGFRVPKDTWMHVSIYSAHRDPAVFKDAAEFVPERFLPGAPEEADVGSGHFQPFGEGALKCVGSRFALEEARVTLVRLAQRFTFTLSPGQVPLALKAPLTLGPAKGVFVTPVARVGAPALAA